MRQITAIAYLREGLLALFLCHTATFSCLRRPYLLLTLSVEISTSLKSEHLKDFTPEDRGLKNKCLYWEGDWNWIHFTLNVIRFLCFFFSFESEKEVVWYRIVLKYILVSFNSYHTKEEAIKISTITILSIINLKSYIGNSK